MYGHLVFERNDSQVTSLQFLNPAPEPETVVSLRLRSNRIVENTLTPFSFQIRPFPRNLVLELLCESVLSHADNDTLRDAGFKVIPCWASSIFLNGVSLVSLEPRPGVSPRRWTKCCVSFIARLPWACLVHRQNAPRRSYPWAGHFPVSQKREFASRPSAFHAPTR